MRPMASRIEVLDCAFIVEDGGSNCRFAYPGRAKESERSFFVVDLLDNLGDELFPSIGPLRSRERPML